MARALLPSVSLTVALACALAPRPASARPQPCPEGRFLLADGASLLATPPPGERAVVAFAGRRLAFDERCGPARAKVKAGRKGTAIGARWRACADRKAVRLTGRIAAPDCSVLRGTIRAKRTAPITFEAVRSACGDGYVDRAAGETCDLPGGGTTTTAPPGGSTTTTLPGGGTGSEPTLASLDAARDALAAGATDVPLSPDGTLRLQRVATPTGAIEALVRNGAPLVQWVHDGDVTNMTADDDGNGLPEVSLTGRRAPVRSAQVRYDLDGDGVVERTVSMTQVGPNGIEAEITEAGQSPVGFSTTLLQETTALGTRLTAAGVVTAVGCNAAQEAAARSGLAAALASGMKCLRDLGLGAIAKAIEGKIARDGVTFRCGGTSDCAQIDILDGVTKGAVPASVGVTLGSQYFSGTGSCFDQGAIVFHELLHMGFGDIHSPFLDRSTFEGLATDRVYSCTDLCFRPTKATKSQCAKCLGVNRCDTKCKGFADGSEGSCDLFVDITSLACPRTSCTCCDQCDAGINWVSTIDGRARGPVGTVLRTNLPQPPDGELVCADWSKVTCRGAIGLCCERQTGQPSETTFTGKSLEPPAINPLGCICPVPPPPVGVEFVAQAIAPDGRAVEDLQADTCP